MRYFDIAVYFAKSTLPIFPTSVYYCQQGAIDSETAVFQVGRFVQVAYPAAVIERVSVMETVKTR